MTGKFPSQFSQRIARLSAKIFGEYYTPPMPKEVAESQDAVRKMTWFKVHHQNHQQIKKMSGSPFDLVPGQTMAYYPPHPQLRELTHTLRKHGLFR